MQHIRSENGKVPFVDFPHFKEKCASIDAFKEHALSTMSLFSPSSTFSDYNNKNREDYNANSIFSNAPHMYVLHKFI